MRSFFQKILGPSYKKENSEFKEKANKLSKTGKHICCVCKETKEARDLCIAKKGVEQCKYFIEAHNQCLRDEGFTVEDTNVKD